MHSEVDHVEPQPDRVDLDDPEDQPGDAEEEQDVIPPPDDQEHLVVDDVEREHADRVDVLLLARGPESVPVAGRDPREGVAHWVLHTGALLLLRRELVVLEHPDAVVEVASRQKAVREEVGDHRDEQVEDLAEDEAVVVDVVLVVDVAAEELQRNRPDRTSLTCLEHCNLSQLPPRAYPSSLPGPQ